MKTKLLVCTRATQGTRQNDFCFCEDGELLMFGSECGGDRRCGADGPCGCRRSLVGLVTAKGTTTFRVEERETPPEEFVNLCLGALQDGGFMRSSDPELREAYADDARQILEIAKSFPVGAILEKRADTIQQRRL